MSAIVGTNMLAIVFARRCTDVVFRRSRVDDVESDAFCAALQLVAL